MVHSLRAVTLAAKSFSSRLMLALLIVALLGFMALFLMQSLQIQKMQAEQQKKQAELALIVERNDQLQEHLDFYKGPGYMLYVEKVAREALGLVKPGETVVLTVADGPPSRISPLEVTRPTGPEAEPAGPPAKKKANWENWLAFFSGN